MSQLNACNNILVKIPDLVNKVAHFDTVISEAEISLVPTI